MFGRKLLEEEVERWKESWRDADLERERLDDKNRELQAKLDRVLEERHKERSMFEVEIESVRNHALQSLESVKKLVTLQVEERNRQTLEHITTALDALRRSIKNAPPEFQFDVTAVEIHRIDDSDEASEDDQPNRCTAISPWNPIDPRCGEERGHIEKGDKVHRAKGVVWTDDEGTT